MMVYVTGLACCLDGFSAAGPHTLEGGRVQKECRIVGLVAGTFEQWRRLVGTVQELVAFGKFFQVDLDLDVGEVVGDVVVEGEGGTYTVAVGTHMAEDGHGLYIA